MIFVHPEVNKADISPLQFSERKNIRQRWQLRDREAWRPVGAWAKEDCLVAGIREVCLPWETAV